MKALGWELPALHGLSRQVAVGALGVSLLAVTAILRRRKLQLHTFEITEPKSSISYAMGTIGAPAIKTSTSGGGKLQVQAARYHHSSDGRNIVCVDGSGIPVQEMIPRSRVADIRRMD